MSIGERLKALRKNLGLTQKEFARKVQGKVDYTYIGKVEREEQYPSLKMLERIGKSFNVPLSYFFQDESISKSLNLLPYEIKKLLKDRKRQGLLRISQELNERDLFLITQIINILSQSKPSGALQVSERKGKYETISEKKRRILIGKIEKVLATSPHSLSLKESWLREVLGIALNALKQDEYLEGNS